MSNQRSFRRKMQRKHAAKVVQSGLKSIAVEEMKAIVAQQFAITRLIAESYFGAQIPNELFELVQSSVNGSEVLNHEAPTWGDISKIVEETVADFKAVQAEGSAE